MIERLPPSLGFVLGLSLVVTVYAAGAVLFWLLRELRRVHKTIFKAKK